MLKITPIFDADERENLCKLCGANSIPNALTYAILSDGKQIGVCQFKLSTGGGRIMILRNICGNNDTDALIIAGRTALDFIERNGGNDAYYDDEDTKCVAENLGFKDGYLSLIGYFGNCKKNCPPQIKCNINI